MRKYSNSEFFFLFSFSEKNLVSIKYCECSLLIFNEFVIAYIYQKMQNDKWYIFADIYLLFEWTKICIWRKKEKKKKKKAWSNSDYFTVLRCCNTFNLYCNTCDLLKRAWKWKVQLITNIRNDYCICTNYRNDVIKTSKIYIQKKKYYKVWFVIITHWNTNYHFNVWWLFIKIIIYHASCLIIF